MSTTGRSIVLRSLTAALIGALAATAIAVVALSQMSPVYSSSTTVGLTLTEQEQGVESLGQVPTASPLFTEAVRSTRTQEAAQRLAGAPLGEIQVSTFRETPIVFTLTGTGESSEQARDTADGYARALEERSAEIFPGGAIRAGVVSEATEPADRDRPRTALTLVVAGLAGALLGAALVHWWQQVRLRSRGPRMHQQRAEVTG